MIEIRRIEGRKSLKRFVQFAIDLYADNPMYVPPIIDMEVDIFDVSKNPVYEFCDSVFFMAYREGKAVGRIAGFINRRSNEKYRARIVRFCWIDFIDDATVSRALLDAVCAWGKEQGMTSMVGPMGPSDIDNEGVLTEGFEHLPTTVNSYNADYYQKHLEAYGFQPDATWYEFRIPVPNPIPEKYNKAAEMVRKRYGLRGFYEPSASVAVKKWGHKIFELMNACYEPIYGFTAFTPAQIDYYVKAYVPMIPMQFLRLVVDKEDNLIAFAVMMPSLSEAQQKAKGHLFPFGWYHMLRAIKCKGATDTADMMLIGVRPDYQGKGVHSIIFSEIVPELHKWGFKFMETNAELVTNQKVQTIWKDLQPVHHKSRVAYKKEI